MIIGRKLLKCGLEDLKQSHKGANALKINPINTAVGLVQINNSFSEQSYLPLSVAFLVSYANKHTKNINNFKFMVPIYKRISVDKATEHLKEAKLVAFSVYVWNFKISCLIAEELKKIDPEVTILFGGCHVPDDDKVLELFMKELSFVDFAIPGEGEVAFASFLENYHAQNWDNVPSLAYLRDGNFVRNQLASRIENLNDIPSPFLSGFFDDLIESNPSEGWIGLWETNRGCPFKCTYCFSGDTLLLLKNGIIRFNQEEYIDKELTCSSGCSHTEKVGKHDDSLIYQGVRKCIKINLSNGLSLSVTDDHEIFCVENDIIVRKEARKLSVEDWVVLQIGQNSVQERVKINVDKITSRMSGKVPRVIDEDLAWMTGLLIGDGNIRKRGDSVRFVATPEIEDKINRLSEKTFCIKPHSYDIGNTDKVKHVEIVSKLAVKTFESIGVLRGKDKLRVPKLILASPASVVRSFLEGLWAADGYSPKNSPPYLTTVSHRLAEESCSLIHWIGDIAQVRKIDSKKYKPHVLYNVQPIYRVAWYSKGRRERDNLRGPCDIANQIPLAFGISKGLKKVQSVGINGRTRGTVSRARLRQFSQNHPLLEENMSFAQVKSVTDAGELEVYDIADQPNHVVAANSVLSHNCDWGVGAKKRMADYDLDRLFKEVDWFSKNKVEFVYCCDANFGMYKHRDLEITKKFVDNKKRYGYPEAFSVQNTKNSTEASYDIQKVMTQNGLSKGVLLAFQTLNKDSLKAIKRDNIKLETYYELQRRFTAEGVETFSDIILGLPEETYETFIDGTSTLMEMGQHNRIQFSNLSILPNSEMGDKEYQEKYGLKLVETKQINTHGSLGEWVDNIYETQHLVIATNTLPPEEWIKCRSFAFMVSLLHFDKLLQIPSILLNVVYGIRYKDLVEAVMQASSPVLTQATNFFFDKARDIRNGGAEYCESKEWLKIFWPADEFFFIKLVKENLLKAFYEESMEVLVDMIRSRNHSHFEPLLKEALEFNEQLIKVPFVDIDVDVHLNHNIWDVYRANLAGESIALEQGEYKYTVDRSSNTWDSWDRWCREVVWYGNKKGAYLYRLV